MVLGVKTPTYEWGEEQNAAHNTVLSSVQFFSV